MNYAEVTMKSGPFVLAYLFIIGMLILNQIFLIITLQIQPVPPPPVKFPQLPAPHHDYVSMWLVRLDAHLVLR